MSTPFSYGQLMPSVTKNFGSGPAEELTAHEYKTLWYAAASDVEKLQTRMVEAADMLRRQHEAIVKLREALHNTKQSLIGNTTCVYSPYADEVIAAAQQALKDTEGL